MKPGESMKGVSVAGDPSLCGLAEEVGPRRALARGAVVAILAAGIAPAAPASSSPAASPSPAVARSTAPNPSPSPASTPAVPGAPGASASAPEPRTAAAPAAPVMIPFAFDKGQIVVEVTLGASGPLRFLLDTGTDPSIINLSTAEGLTLPLGEPSDVGQGAGTGPMQIRRCFLPTLSMGPLSTAALEAAAVDLSGLSAQFGKRIDGVLGYGFLKDRLFTIDYAARTLVFYTDLTVDRAALFHRGRGRTIVPFEFIGEDRTPFARILSVAGSASLRVTIDTGSSGSAAIYDSTAQRLGWQNRIEKAAIRTNEGYRGSFASAVVSVDRLSFAGFDLGPTDVTVPLPGSNYGEDGDGTIEGNVGNALLSRFRITFDYPKRILLVERVEAPTAETTKPQ